MKAGQQTRLSFLMGETSVYIYAHVHIKLYRKYRRVYGRKKTKYWYTAIQMVLKELANTFFLYFKCYTTYIFGF